MRKILVLVGLLILAVGLFVACGEEQATGPDEALFKPGNKKVDNECTGVFLEQKNDLDDAVETVFLYRPSRKGALQNVDNIARKICDDPPNYEGALEAYYLFEALVLGQDLEKMQGGEIARDALLMMAYQLATGAEYDPGFTLWVIEPGQAEELVANNFEGALRILPGTFPPDAGEITVVAYRLPDDYDGAPDYSFAPYIPLPELWFFDATTQPDPEGPGFEAWVCLVDGDIDPGLFDRSVVAHALTGGGVELLPRITENSPLDCTNAEEQVALGPAPQNWLQLAGSVARPILNRFFGVKSLHASYFGGKGLGGRGTSFSPHAPVDTGIDDPVISFISSELNQEVVENPGVFFNRYNFEVTNWESYPAELFELTSANGPCQSNDTPSRTWVEIYDAADDSRLYGFCALESPEGLTGLWFTTPVGQAPPDFYIELWDRTLDVRYRSNTVVVPTVFNTLTVEGAGSGTGTITRAPDIDCAYDGEVSSGDCTHSAEEWVRYGGLTATPDEGSEFTGWSGACSGTDPCLVEMDADKTAIATFTSTETFTLDIVIVGDGYVSDESEGIDCPETCSAEFAAGETVYLWGSEGEFSFLDDVIGNCEDGGDPDCTIIMNQDETVEFLFVTPG